MTYKLNILLLNVVACVLILTGCRFTTTTPQQEQQKNIQQTQIDREQADLLKRLDRRYENPITHYKLGKLYQRQGLLAKAQYQFNVALSFDPALWPAQAALVKTLEDNGQKQKAQTSADIFINQAVGKIENSLELALAFQNEDLPEYALKAYTQAQIKQPNSPLVNKKLGFFYLKQNDKENAREYLTRSFKLNPNQPDVAQELGRLGVALEIKKPQKEQEKQKD